MPAIFSSAVSVWKCAIRSASRGGRRRAKTAGSEPQEPDRQGLVRMQGKNLDLQPCFVCGSGLAAW